MSRAPLPGDEVNRIVFVLSYLSAIFVVGTVVLIALFFFGGTVIHGFVFAMLVGTVAGVYSTVFIASPIVLAFERIMPSKTKRK